LPPQTPPSNERNLLQAVDGATLFQAHCAVCHGKDAAGGGPAASALKKAVPDLTRISQRRRGTFPLDEVQLTIAGNVVPSPAHGSREMPIWGPVFSRIEWDQDLGRIRIYNLAKYLETLQKK
jgi:mono/diheme cytochrome c family protein